MADHLCADAGSRRRRADVHALKSLDLPMIGRFMPSAVMRTQASHVSRSRYGRAAASAAPRRDPVCGMSVDPATAKHKAEHGGRALLFLLRRLPREIRRRAGALSEATQAAPPKPAPAGAIYTCPMHPADPPGRARRTARSAAWRWSRRRRRRRPGPNAELVDMTRRFWIGSRSPSRSSRSIWAVISLGLHHAVRRRRRTGSSSCSRRRSCCGRAGRSSSAAGPRSRPATSTCSR